MVRTLSLAVFLLCYFVKGKKKKQTGFSLLFLFIFENRMAFSIFQPFITACIAERSAAAFMLTGKGAKVKR